MNTIEICSSLKEEQTIAKVFLHEVLHGIYNSLGCELNDDEKHIDRIAEILYQIIPQLEE